jgi:hypothetical protein
MRVAGGDASTNISAQNSTLALTMTDAGAIKAAFGFADKTLAGSLEAIRADDESDADQVRAAIESVKESWADAKAGEQKVLVGMGLVVVGLVAVAALKKG